jgi:hypothetical protein
VFKPSIIWPFAPSFGRHILNLQIIFIKFASYSQTSRSRKLLDGSMRVVEDVILGTLPFVCASKMEAFYARG